MVEFGALVRINVALLTPGGRQLNLVVLHFCTSRNENTLVALESHSRRKMSSLENYECSDSADCTNLITVYLSTNSFKCITVQHEFRSKQSFVIQIQT